MICNDPSSKGLCSAPASDPGMVIHTSHSSGVVRTTGIALGWIAPTSAFGVLVRKAKRSIASFPVLTFRTLVHCGAQMPAKKASGQSSPKANQTSCRATWSNPLKLVNGTRHRLSTPSHRFQCELAVLRTFVVPLSGSIRRSRFEINLLALGPQLVGVGAAFSRFVVVIDHAIQPEVRHQSVSVAKLLSFHHQVAKLPGVKSSDDGWESISGYRKNSSEIAAASVDGADVLWLVLLPFAFVESEGR